MKYIYIYIYIFYKFRKEKGRKLVDTLLFTKEKKKDNKWDSKSKGIDLSCPLYNRETDTTTLQFFRLKFWDYFL